MINWAPTKDYKRGSGEKCQVETYVETRLDLDLNLNFTRVMSWVISHLPLIHFPLKVKVVDGHLWIFTVVSSILTM